MCVRCRVASGVVCGVCTKSGPTKGQAKPDIGTKMVVHKEEDSKMMAVAKALKAVE